MSKIKIIIVEDEELIRQGIAESIAESDEGARFEVAAAAGDGEEALEMLAAMGKDVPEIVITDIRMPFMDGITLLEKLKPLYPEMYVVILSGHDGFEYARRALKAGAYDYLLKPIKIKNLMDILKNIKAELDEKSLRDSELLSLKEAEQSNKLRQKSNYLTKLMRGQARYVCDGALSANEAAGFHAAGIVDIENMALLSIGYDYLQLVDMDARFEELTAAAARHPGTMILKDRLCECLLYVHAPGLFEANETIAALRKELHALGTSELKLRVSFGEAYDSPDRLRDSYIGAVGARERELLNAIAPPGGFDESGLNRGAPYMDFDDAELLLAVRTGDKPQIDAQIKLLAQRMKEQKVVSLLHMIMVGASVYFDVSKLLAEASFNSEEALRSNLEHFNRLIVQNNPDALLEKLKAYCHTTADFLEQVHSGRFAAVLRRAKEYIRQNFMTENLMLEDVAQHAFISASYLCIIFKKEAGETFIEYLTRVRMEHAAKLLLGTDLRNYEIAEACGYSNPTYFSTIFKKCYDMPPSAYKARYGKRA